jgi:site-specific DNA-methyltransferase (adenine-specific)
MKDQVIQGDCLIEMQKIEDKSIDMVLTSPPYDNLRDYKCYTFNFEGIAKEIYRVLKDGGVCVWIVGDATIKGSESGTSFKQALYFKEIGFNLHDTMIYRKINPIPLTHNRYEQGFEFMFVLSKGKPKTFNPIMVECKTKGMDTKRRTFYQKADGVLSKGNKNEPVKNKKQKDNVWDIPTYSGKYGHPAIFPEKLAEDHILSWSNEGDTILDPMAGSGTTLKMAKNNNRNYIGIEISQEYIDIINKRLSTPPLGQRSRK